VLLDKQPVQFEAADPWFEAFKQWGLPTPTGTPSPGWSVATLRLASASGGGRYSTHR
jgi:hypothetical protein